MKGAADKPQIRVPSEERMFKCSDGSAFENFQEAGAWQAYLDLVDWLTTEVAVYGQIECEPAQLATLLREHWNITPKDE